MLQTILGAGGPIGIELARSLSMYTNEIRLVSRNPKPVNESDNLFIADLTKRDEVYKAVNGSAIVYVTIGFPYDTNIWRDNWIPFIHNVVDACIENKCKLVFFDNVYGIGADHIEHITEISPMYPTSKKGVTRAVVDRFILDNIVNHRIQAIIARAPDFFGGTATANSILINTVYNNLIKGKKAKWFCDAKRIHSMGYVPDLAKGTAMLGNTPSAYNQVWNLPTDPQKITGEEWIELFASALNKRNAYSVVPGWMIHAIGLFVPIMKELAEMNYQYDRDYYFDSSKFNNHFNFTPTPNRTAVKLAIEQLQMGQ